MSRKKGGIGVSDRPQPFSHQKLYTNVIWLLLEPSTCHTIVIHVFFFLAILLFLLAISANYSSYI